MAMHTNSTGMKSGPEVWRSFTKLAFASVFAGYFHIIACRLIFYPDFGVGSDQFFFLRTILALLLLIIVWHQYSRPNLHSQLLTCFALTLSGLVTAFTGGVHTLWTAPIIGALFGLTIVYPSGGRVTEDRLFWHLSRTSWALYVLFTSVIIGIGLTAWLGREGEAREAHLLIRSVFSALLVMSLWSTAIILVQKQWHVNEVRTFLLRIFGLAFVLFSVFLIAFHSELSKYSVTNLDGQFRILRVVLSFTIFLIAWFFARSNFVRLFACAMPPLWAALTSSGQYVANIPVLSAMAVLPLIVRFPNRLLAAAYWAVILAILAFGLGITEPLFVMNGMAATLIFVSSYWLGQRLEAFAAAEGIGEQAAKGAQLAPFTLDRRSASIGLAAGGAVLLIGGGLLYADYSRERELARVDAQKVAERLADRISTELEEQERIAEAFSRLPLERITSQAEFEQATTPIADLFSEATLQWAPQAVIRFVHPLKGNEAAIGLNLLAMTERKADFEHIIATGEAHWLGPYDLARGGRGLLHTMPIYRPGAEPSRQSFVGVLSALMELDHLIARRVVNDAESYSLRVWLSNPTIGGQEARPQLIYVSADGDEAHAGFGGTAQASSSPDANKDALTVTVEAYPRSIEALDTLPARLQGLLIITLVVGISIATSLVLRRRFYLAQGALLGTQARLSAFVESTPSAVIVSDKNGIIIDWNLAAEKLFGHRREQVLGKNVNIIIPHQHRAAHDAGIERVASGGEKHLIGQITEVPALHASGDQLMVEVSLSTWSLKNEPYFSAIIQDIRDRKKAEAARTQFLSNISHDLRTPLSVVIGSVQMLESAPLEGAHRIRLKRLQQASNVLFNLVNDVLDWSKIEAGEIDLEHEPVNLADIFETIVTVMGEVTEEKGIALTCDRAADLPEYVIGDAARIQQILFNLVGNAIKFTDEGEVGISASKVAPHEADNVRLRIEVRDTGVGISSEGQELLFQRFSQVDKSSTRRFQGTGLGLSIVKQLAELMGGGVGVESKLGVGSTFWVEVELGRLDKVPIEQEVVAKRQEKPLAGKHVLLVDDSDLVTELAELMLETAGANTSTCTNGQEALDWLALNPDKADIVLMDVQMPIMDGLTAITIMRRDPVLQAVPVVAMTAGATKTKIEELLAAGMTDYITKPFTQEQLEYILLSQVGSKPF